LLRDTDGFALAMVPLADLEVTSEIGQAALALLRAESGLRRADAHASDLGPLAWLLVFDEDDRAQFFVELSDAVALAHATRDVRALRTCLRDSQTTAEALSDPLGVHCSSVRLTTTSSRSSVLPDPKPGAYRPHVAARRPGGRPVSQPLFRVLVHRRYLDTWNSLAERVGLENAQRSWDHVAFTPGSTRGLGRRQ
jgi:hypothetical protein